MAATPVKNTIRCDAMASVARLLNEGRPFGDWSFFNSSGRISTGGLTRNEGTNNADCVGPAMVFIAPRFMLPIAQRFPCIVGSPARAPRARPPTTGFFDGLQVA